MLLLLPFALAHVPHDKVSAVIAAEGDPWLAIANPGRRSLLLVSRDEGISWDLAGGAPTAETIRAGARLSNGAWVLLGDQHLWVTDDQGKSWSMAPVPGDVTLLEATGNGVVIAGAGGAWEGPALGPFEAIGRSGEVVTLLGTSTLVYEDGGLWARGAGWHEVLSLGPTTTSATVHGGVLYAAAGNGQVWHLDTDAWVACPVIPDSSDWLRLSSSGDTLYVTSDKHAVWRSQDGCATWEDLRAPLQAEYGVSGGVEVETEAFPVVQAVGDRLVVAGWAGLAVYDGDGWAIATILPAGYTRGLVVSPDLASDGLIWWGTYAGGIARTDDGGATWEAPNLGTLDPNVQSLALDRDGATLYAISGHVLRRSTDDGRIWHTLKTGFNADESVIVWQDAGHVWVTGRSDSGIESTEVRESRDAGDTWHDVTTLSAFIPGADARAVTRVLQSVCVSTSDRTLACSDDEGQSWDTRFTADADLADPVGWPKEGPTRILVIDDAGVHYSDDAGVSWTVVEIDPLDPPAILAIAPDNSVFLLTASGRLWRSSDGGESWGATAVRLPADTFHLVARPDFHDHPELLAGTADGLYRIEDATGNPFAAPWAPWERVEASGTEFGACTSCPDARDWPGAGTVDVQPLGADARWETTLRGRILRVYGATLGTADFSVKADGVVVASGADLWDPNVALRAEVPLDDAGWHHVEISGRNFLLDAVEAEGPLAPLDGVDIGCTSSGAAPMTVGALAGMLLGRRARRC